VETFLKRLLVALAFVALQLNQFFFEVLLDPDGDFLTYIKQNYKRAHCLAGIAALPRRQHFLIAFKQSKHSEQGQ